MADFGREGRSGLIVAPTLSASQIARLSSRWPRSTGCPRFIHSLSSPKEGGLISYGFDERDQFRQGAVYVDKILRGAKPADLPVQYPTKFEIVINLKTAKALGLDVPSYVLQLADDLVE